MRQLVTAAVLVGLVVGGVRGGAPAGPVTPEEVGAALVRTATLDLGMRISPLAEDYEIAGAALWLAGSMRPNDAETARLLAAAAWSAGDREMLLEATRQVVRLDPADTVAQLRLISANINARQTVEQRLEAYERFLGPAGRTLDASVRSRLALDAALLMREVGDNAGFERRLRDSVDLDPTNKDAVSLATRTFGTDDAAVTELAAWQTRLLYADPLDPHVHFTLARICSGQGALDSAERFLANAVRLFRVVFGETPTSLREIELAFMWHRRGAPAVLETLNPPLRDAREQAAALIEMRRAAGEPTSDLPTPDKLRYDPGIDRIRLLAAHSVGDDETVESALFDLGANTSETLQKLGEMLSQQGVDVGQVVLEMIRVFSEFQVTRLMVQRDPQLVREQIDGFFGPIPGALELLQPLQAWIAYAEKDYIRALDLVGQPRPGTNDDMLVALAYDRLGDTDRAVPIYMQYARQSGVNAYGGMARARLKQLGREQEIISSAGRQLETAFARVPAWIDRMTMDPRSFMMLQAEVVSATVGPLEPSKIRVRLRNAGAIPLGLGASRPIGSRILIGPRPISRLADFAGAPTPKVLEFDRRLRLEPLQDLEVEIEADSAYTSWLREVNAHVSLRDRYRVVQSFQPSPRGGLINAPLALVTESSIIQRLVLELAREGVERIESTIASGEPAGLRPAIVATMSRMIAPAQGLALTDAEQRRLASAWTARFADSSQDERALMLLKLPHGRQVPAMLAFDEAVIDTVLEEAARRGGAVDGGVLIAAMMTRVTDPENAVFGLAGQSDDPRIRRLADRLRARLIDGRPTFANAGPGVGGLAPPGSGSMELSP